MIGQSIARVQVRCATSLVGECLSFLMKAGNCEIVLHVATIAKCGRGHSSLMPMTPVGTDKELHSNLILRKKPKIIDPKRWDVPYHQ